MKYLFIDDERIPKDKTHDWDIVRNYNQFKEWIDKFNVHSQPFRVITLINILFINSALQLFIP